jgi:hypothetical protein
MVGVWIGTRFDTFVYQLPLAFRLWPSADDSSEYAERNRVVQPSVEWSVAAIGDGS